MILSTYFTVRNSYLSNVDSELDNISHSVKFISQNFNDEFSNTLIGKRDDSSSEKIIGISKGPELINSDFYFALVEDGKIVYEQPSRFHIQDNTIQVMASPDFDLTFSDNGIKLSTVDSVSDVDPKDDLYYNIDNLPFIRSDTNYTVIYLA
jgi:hypothetical protein